MQVSSIEVSNIENVGNTCNLYSNVLIGQFLVVHYLNLNLQWGRNSNSPSNGSFRLLTLVVQNLKYKKKQSGNVVITLI